MSRSTQRTARPREVGLRLMTSNRMEVLAEGLAQVLDEPLSSVFEPEVVLVQSQGMARWLKQCLARRRGIAAHIRFPFPRAFMESALKEVAPGNGGQSVFEREALVWRLMRIVPQVLGRAEFDAVTRYVGDGQDARKVYQLCERLAYLFDQYLVYRPDWILEWERKGEVGDWQAILWREIRREIEERSPAELWEEFGRRLSRLHMEKTNLPERIAVFGIAALPPIYLDVLAGLAQLLPVHIFLLQPSREYWADVVSAGEASRLEQARGGQQLELELPLDRGNPLVGSLGKLGRDFLGLVYERAEFEEEQQFVEPEGKTLLEQVQRDLLDLVDRSAEGEKRGEVREGDASIEVHSCHSAMRELEVLHDHMLAWLEAGSALQPSDMVVMAPDIEAYAPYIEAVFGSPEQPEQKIPFRVADQSARRTSGLVGAFVQLLDFAGSRLGVLEVLSFFELAPVRRRFGLQEPDLEVLRNWLQKAQVRWGKNEEHRRALGLPAVRENTWESGLDRLFAGYALGGGERRLMEGILPAEDVEGSQAQALGPLAEFLSQLFRFTAELDRPRPTGAWEKFLGEALHVFFAWGEEEQPHANAIRGALREMAGAAETGEFKDAVAFGAVRECLGRAFAEDRFGSGFLTGAVTFCALKPMRSIPFRMVCVLGLNDGVFPRSVVRLPMDRMVQHPRRGDRSSRDDDRYLFLETILSAREKLYLSYLGQSIRDNSELPPSVVLQELLDYLERGYETPGQRLLADQVITKERLQAFSPVYFTGVDARWFSYSVENSLASRTLVGVPERRGFLEEPLAEPEEEWRNVRLGDLAEFFCNPAKYLLVRRLGLRLPERQDALEQSEAFQLEGLARYQTKEELLERKLAGESLEVEEGLLRASGRLPWATPGRLEYSSLRREVERFAEKIQPLRGGGWREPRAIDLEVGGFRLEGSLRRRTESGLVHFRCAKIKAKDVLRLWVEHAALNCVELEGESVLAGENEVRRYAPAVNARAVLEGLLAVYWVGLRQALPFLPECSRAYVEARARDKDPVQAVRAAWEGNVHQGRRGEGEDPFAALCFGESGLMNEEFGRVAEAVYGPLLACETREEW